MVDKSLNNRFFVSRARYIWTKNMLDIPMFQGMEWIWFQNGGNTGFVAYW